MQRFSCLSCKFERLLLVYIDDLSHEHIIFQSPIVIIIIYYSMLCYNTRKCFVESVSFGGIFSLDHSV